MSNECELQSIRTMNFRIITLLGMVMHIIQKIPDHENDKDCQWFFRAVEDVIYNDKPIPPFTDFYGHYP